MIGFAEMNKSYDKQKPVRIDVIKCFKCGSKITKDIECRVICNNCYWFVKDILDDLEDVGIEVPKTRFEKTSDKFDRFGKFVFDLIYDGSDARICC
jgi:hypothetical protein